jgi:hypothetical protein
LREDARIDAVFEKISLRTKRSQTRDVDQAFRSEGLGVAAAATERDQNDAPPGAAIPLILGRSERPARKNARCDGKSGGSKAVVIRVKTNLPVILPNP